MYRLLIYCVLACVFCCGAAASQVNRGELLYSTYCNACHAEQVHWRDKRLVADWPSLRAEVARWQINGKIEWSEDDIDVVARYLNQLHYHYPQPEK
ncbi:MAG: hypothetical protein HY847_08650 [Betaproteobacteria bacterium]|nr:hypothetical protein [Betaproteobacteria bacterium]